MRERVDKARSISSASTGVYSKRSASWELGVEGR